MTVDPMAVAEPVAAPAQEQDQDASVFSRRQVDRIARLMYASALRDILMRIVPAPTSKHQDAFLNELWQQPEHLAYRVEDVLRYVDQLAAQEASGQGVGQGASAPTEGEREGNVLTCAICGQPAMVIDSGDAYCAGCYDEESGSLSLATED